MSDFPEELIFDFITECSELIEGIEPEMLSSNSLNKDLANNMFRPVHSLKGSSASLGFNNIAKAVHGAEELLSLFRSGEYESTDDVYLQFFLGFFDFIRKGFEVLAQHKSDDSIGQESLKIQEQAKKLKEQLKGNKSADVKQEAPAPAPAEPVTPVAPVISAPIEAAASVASTPQPAPTPAEEEVIDNGNFIDEDMLHAFKTEAQEGVNSLEVNLLNLSKNSDDKEILKECFRITHSFKGNCGIFSLKDLEALGHRMESLFDSILTEKIKPYPAMFNTLMSLIDVLRDKVINLSTSSNGKVENIETYLKLLDEYINNAPKTEMKVETVAIVEEKKDAPLPPPSPTPIIADNKASESKKENKNQRQDIRVDLMKLDILNNLVGELVTVKTMVHEHFKEVADHEKADKTYRFLNRITTELQDISMNIRMIPISGLFKRMIRIVHDISSKSGKKVNFKFQGEETEIDKTVIEKITDPLVHMIRNACDHGIESPEDREKAGKEKEGSLTLSAKNEAGEIWISIQDDGRGLNREAIINKGIAQGLIKDPSIMSDSEIYNLIFLPGFSTAKQITDISGRGVGMDVVRQNIQSLKGKVDIHTTLGEGTTFIIKIPLTLAIIQGMMLEVGTSKYTIPIETINESVKVNTDQISRPMESQELVKIRNQMIPIVRLADIHHIANATQKIEDGILVIAELHGKRIALLVDRLLGQQETVVKPLPKYFKNIKGLSGCSILGNGDATLILDIGSLIELIDDQNKEKIKNKKTEGSVEKRMAA